MYKVGISRQLKIWVNQEKLECTSASKHRIILERAKKELTRTWFLRHLQKNTNIQERQCWWTAGMFSDHDRIRISYLVLQQSGEGGTMEVLDLRIRCARIKVSQ